MAVENRGGSEQSCLAQQSPGEGRGPSPGGSLQGAAQMIPTPVPGEPQSPPCSEDLRLKFPGLHGQPLMMVLGGGGKSLSGPRSSLCHSLHSHTGDCLSSPQTGMLNYMAPPFNGMNSFS